MMRRILVFAIAAMASTACSKPPAQPDSATATPETFVGTWRSVTPSLEFIRLTVVSKSSQSGVLGTRLTLSGLAWEGDGKIEGDSLVAQVAASSFVTPTRVLVVTRQDAKTLRVRLGAATDSTLVLTLVRDD